VGTWKFYLAPAGETKPALDATPAGNWVELGATEGDQTFQYTGTMTAIRDNTSTGALKHIRPEEGFTVTARLAHLKLEDKAKVFSMAATSVATATSGSLNVKQLGLKRGFTPTRYALLARGGALEETNSMSPYGAWPAQLWLPSGVFDGEPQEVFNNSGSPVIEFIFRAEVDTTQAVDKQFGFLEVQQIA